MNKSSFIEKLFLRTGVPRYECTYYLNVLLDVIGDELEKSDSLVFQGFGTFSLWQQSAREDRNPRTKEIVPIVPRTSVNFNPGRYLLNKLNGTGRLRRKRR